MSAAGFACLYGSFLLAALNLALQHTCSYRPVCMLTEGMPATWSPNFSAYNNNGQQRRCCIVGLVQIQAHL